MTPTGRARRGRDGLSAPLPVRRAKEIAAPTWALVTDGHGEIADYIALPDETSKGKSGRTVYLHPDLTQAPDMLRRVSPDTRPG